MLSNYQKKTKTKKTSITNISKAYFPVLLFSVGPIIRKQGLLIVALFPLPSKYKNTILYGSIIFLHILKEKHWLIFVLDYLYKEALSQTGFEYRDSVSPQSTEQFNNCGRWKLCLPLAQRAGMHTDYYKIFLFPKFRTPLLEHDPLCVQVSFGLLHINLYKLKLEELAQKWWYSTSIAVSNNLFFISDPGVLCLLPAPMILL